MSKSRRALTLSTAATVLTAVVTVGHFDPQTAFADANAGQTEFAECGPGSQIETGVQGQVPLADRRSGRSTKGYWCNLEMLGGYQGEGASAVAASYRNCAYLPTTAAAGKRSPGTQIVDVSDPARPRLAGTLQSPALISDTWESLKVHEGRGLLAGVGVGPGAVGGLFFDVYDISADCTKPRLLNRLKGAPSASDTRALSTPGNALGHEGGWSPDGRTYWASGVFGGSITAIDMAIPTDPHILFTGTTGDANHGFGISADGQRLYMSSVFPAGVTTFDISDIQRRKPFPTIRELSRLTWSDGFATQHSIPISIKGRRFLITVDEAGAGGIRFIDVSDDRRPRIDQQLRLAIQLPQHVGAWREDTAGNGNFGYNPHYCTVDRTTDPTLLACGYLQSGIRVFDVANRRAIKEIAYFNPPAQTGKAAQLRGSLHAANPFAGAPIQVFEVGRPDSLSVDPASTAAPNLTADWCSSPPRFVGRDQLWTTCMDNGFLALRFTNRARAVVSSRVGLR